MSHEDINCRICRIFGIPGNAFRAVVVLEPNSPPRVTVEKYMANDDGEVATTEETFQIVPAIFPAAEDR